MTPEETFDQQVGHICSRDSRYRPAAYAFIRDGVAFTLQLQESDQPPAHVTGAQLSEGCRQLALQQYGPLALTVLNEWGITTTRDLGHIVFNMADARLLGIQESDKLADFDDCFDFTTAFDTPYRPTGTAAPLPVVDRPC